MYVCVQGGANRYMRSSHTSMQKKFFHEDKQTNLKELCIALTFLTVPDQPSNLHLYAFKELHIGTSMFIWTHKHTSAGYWSRDLD